MSLYDYTSTNTELVKDLDLLRHIEGGYFKETHRCEEEVSSPLAGGDPRPVSTTIYYLLTANEPRGYFHRNRSHTMHVLHQGRSEYCLIEAGNGKSGPSVSYKVMGADHSKGETRQLFVAGQVWKMSGIPQDDLAFAGEDLSKKEKVGCLITEVVTPGFVWQDHEWMTMDHLTELFEDAPKGDEMIKKYSKYLRPSDLDA